MLRRPANLADRRPSSLGASRERVMGLLDKKVAVVTGGAQGIGAAIVERLASEGASIAVVDINAEKAAEKAAAVRALGVEAESYKVDVSNTEDVKTLVGEIVKRFGRIDI